ncbi:YusU family protein [Mesobacillus maritimus]|uniref:DUF2573 family protein n=1 Tax=Mesobacillus maritimus TaxID=1643336 RepID=UPI00203A398C|nr:DUF2573 family protein [Mesobacillus maritimus]MCM3585084.1 YusU family protein [Mesobacillus maritimus]MCM3670306.1 YusU family protein [Mesobacillus maritimus]
MNEKLTEQLDGLLEKYAELLVGHSSNEYKEKVKAWIIYNHIAKTMPPLAQHWNKTYPDAKENIMQVIKEIKELNEQNRKKE